MCYADAPGLFAAVAANCPGVSTTGASIVCTPSPDGVQVQVGATATTAAYAYTFAPAQIPCTYDLQGPVELGAAIFGAVALAWVVRILSRAI